METMSSGVDRSNLFVLLGAAGDLAGRLVVPALFELYRDGALPEQFRLLGVDRSDLDRGALAERLREGCARFGRGGTPSEAQWQGFAQLLSYHRMDVSEPDDYRALPAVLEELVQPMPAPVQRIYYLATPPFLFAPAATGLGNAGLVTDKVLSRLVVEKPIGSNLDSFRHIDGVLKSWLDESQLYRIDHYLGKETAQNILALRFANPLFEPIWNRRYIDHVTITVAETLGVEHRGGYYEGAGALRDMVSDRHGAAVELRRRSAARPQDGCDAGVAADPAGQGVGLCRARPIRVRLGRGRARAPLPR